MAGGVTLAREAVDRFRALFQEHTRRVLQGTTVVNAIEHDGPLTCADLTAALLDELATVEPYGQGFPRPVFVIEDALVENLRVVGKDGVHLKLILSQAGTRAEAIWFYAREGAQDPLPVSVGTRRSFAIEPSANWYRGQAKVQARILGAIIER